MRVLLQRVKSASVTVENAITGKIGKGVLLFVGFEQGDGMEQIEWMCNKIVRLRIFPDAEDKMNLSLADVGGALLIVSQFTLYGDVRKGTRPSYSKAAPPASAQQLYDAMIDYCKRNTGLDVQTGIFGAMMDVELVNDGPVTIWLERPGNSGGAG